MKAYLITTGIVFGLVAVLHLVHGIADRQALQSEPAHFLFMAGLGVFAAALSVWAWRLLLRIGRPG